MHHRKRETEGPEKRNAAKVKRNLLSGCAFAIIMSAVFPNQATAQGEGEILDEIVVVSLGSRANPRTSTTSPVAIDAFDSEAILASGATETGRALQDLVPSFNFSSSSISDGTDSLRPATLRGLGPDQTLVLINGKRRHKSALIHVNTSVGRGTAGTDINAITPGAIKGVEVLRDGASSLYGSDAIAGVINFQLKDSDDAGSILASAGQTYESDGTTFTASVNKGFVIADDGFLNLTYEYRNRENTNRAGLTGTCQYVCTTNSDGNYVADPSTEDLEIAFDRQNFRIGDSDSEQHAVFANMGLVLNDHAEFYAFGSYGHRENESAGFYRRANVGGDTLLEFYPDGFLPLIRPTVVDLSLTGGIEWNVSEVLMVDTSFNYGSNSFSYEIANTNNVSLGLSSPTVFDAGQLQLSEWGANIDAVYSSDIVSVAFGGGFRRENYQIIAGEPASYADGGFVNFDTLHNPAYFSNIDGATGQDLGVAGDAGSQVFRGFSPDNAVDEDRDSYSGYIEVSRDITDRINAQVSGRFEDYEGFGSTATWKVAAIWEAMDIASLRGSVSTGFRAPSMQQLYFNSASTQFVTENGVTVLKQIGTFRNDSVLAQDLGVPELKEESSLSWGLGAILKPVDGWTMTVDFYNIEIDDRIMISAAIDQDKVTGSLQEVFTSSGVDSAQFFLNGVNTRTRGVDIVSEYNLPLSVAGGDLKLTAAANFTDTEVLDELPAPGLLEGLDLITAVDISIIEEWQPKSRINIGGSWVRDNWLLNLSSSRYGEYTVCEGDCSEEQTQTYSAKWITDIQVDYRFDRGVTLSVGANNAFDVTPDLNEIGQARGGTVYDSSGNLIIQSDGVFQYSRRSAPFGFNGGYYYARVKVDI